MIALGILAVLGAAGLTAAVVDVGGGESQDSGEDDQYNDAQPAAYTKDTNDTSDLLADDGGDDTDLLFDDDEWTLPDDDYADVSDDDLFFDDDDLNLDDDYYTDLDNTPSEGDDFIVIGSENQPETLDEPINLLGGDDVAILENVTGAGESHTEVNGGEGDDIIDLTNSANLSVNGGDGADSFVLTNSTDLSVNGGEGDDSFLLLSNGTDLSMDGGAGNDIIFMETNIGQSSDHADTDIPQITLGEGNDILSVDVGFVTGDAHDNADVDEDGYIVTRPFQIMDFNPNEDSLDIWFNRGEDTDFPGIQDITYQQVELADSIGYQTVVKVLFEKATGADPDAPSAAMEFTVFSKEAFGVDNWVMNNEDDDFYMSSLTLIAKELDVHTDIGPDA